MYNIMALLCGFIFGCGLTISNMINANKVMDFLDFTGNWDASLAFVMIGAVIVTWIGYKFVIRETHPKLAKKFFLSEKKSIDTRLILGAAIFGIGWGLAGYCPGPAFTALGLRITDPLYFVIGMLISLFTYPLLSSLSRNKKS